jgi:hypothetical protein
MEKLHKPLVIGCPSFKMINNLNNNKMKAEDLRIGNWVYITDTSTQLFYKEEVQINIHNLMYLCGECKEPIEFDIEPIPLTEEWFLKFGFKSIDKSGNDFITYTDQEHNYYFQIDVRKNDGKYLILDNSFDDLRAFSMVDFTTVHQLQNIYYALTGVELSVS